jgi:hypothetical protein
LKIPIRGKHPFITANDVENNDLATIIEEPTIQSPEDNKFGKERTLIIIVLKRTKIVYRWGLNTKSNDALVKAFGEEGSLWVNCDTKIEKKIERIGGKERTVLYAVPQPIIKQEKLSETKV